MDLFEPQLLLRREVRFSGSRTHTESNANANFGDVFGGIIKSGQWGWLTKGSSIHVTSLRTGQLISKFIFDDKNGFGVCIITCVSEIIMPHLTGTIICIGIQYPESFGGLAVIYCVEQSKVIRCIELNHKITCCQFISQEIAQHTVLQNMSGCLAIGTDGGTILLVDVNMKGDELIANTLESGVFIVPCHIVDYSMSVLHLHRHFQHCQQEGVHFGIQLEVLKNASFIQSLLPVGPLLSLAVGLADGRLALYDLTDIQVFYITPPQEISSPLVKMQYMEPPDDPRPCVYIWAFHENYLNSMAVMHSLMYEKRIVSESGFCFFENFQVACVRLLLPLGCPKSIPITCQTITKAPSHGNEDTISLCALVWKQDQELQTEVLVFDINQWYREEMPYVGDWKEDPSYLASFVLKDFSLLDMYFDAKTISLFNSIHRPEEHFYPVSLSFDSIALGEKSCVHLNWPGAQNRVIDVLRYKSTLALLDPNPVFNVLKNTGLLPQFCGLNSSATFSLKAKREVLLSVALEQNCIGLLKDCAKRWSDGSHQGKSLDEGLSMSTLTDWLWTRALSIKERCNSLCQVLFDHSGCALDQREQKELGYISKQLKTLADLLSDIILKYGENIRSDVLPTLESQNKSIRIASEYQEILLWLLNIGLLPEASRLRGNRDVESHHGPYPYESLKRFYENRRLQFTRFNEKFSSRKTRSCYLLFIDSFIDHVFKGNSLWDSWQESGGNGLYPPTSIQAMLRIMLIPDVDFDNKCALFLYLFLDLNMAIEDKQYEAIVQNFIKFPSVFKLSASLIKQIQAFWNLDHCRFQAAIDEFISPFNKDQVCPQWQLELFLESLLAQNESNLSLRVLEAKSYFISPVLQLNTYLANDLISEAFHFARSKQDEDLLKLFFTGCLCNGKFGVIRDLALTEKEGILVQSLLKNSKFRNGENVHFVYLLQKYKYIEAISYLDELSKKKGIKRAVDVDTPTLVLSAYNTTITPLTKSFSDVYFKIKNKLKSKETEQKSPYPLSCQLIKQNANDLLGGIYQSSALSAHFASHYRELQQTDGNSLKQTTNAPFLRRPQVPSSYAECNPKETISYPELYSVAQKRFLENSLVEGEKASKFRENPKKRRKVYHESDLDAVSMPMRSEQPMTCNLLTHFKASSVHDIDSLTRKSQKPTLLRSGMFLETPYVKNTVVDTLGGVTSTLISEKSSISLQGILKVSQPNPKTSVYETDRSRSVSVESDKKGNMDTAEEKSIRFFLPSVECESEGHTDDEDSSIKNECSKKLKELPQSYRRHAGPAQRKSLMSCRNLNKDLHQFSSDETLSKLGANTDARNQNIVIEATCVSTSLENVNNEDFYEQPSSYVIGNLRFTSEEDDIEDFKNSITKNRYNSRCSLREALPNYSHDHSKSSSSFEKARISKQSNLTVLDTEDSMPTVPLNFFYESSGSKMKTKVKDINDTHTKQSMRALSEDKYTSTYSLHRGTKQLQGRVSIHCSLSDIPDNKTVTALQTNLKSISGNILKTDTTIDFKPPMSSSRVSATESKFHTGTTETANISETTSQVTFSERLTILGDLTYLPSFESTGNFTDTINATTTLVRNQMLDTTLDMTMYDTKAFEKSHQQLTFENSTSSDALSGNRDSEEASASSELNILDDIAVQKSRISDDSDSVILLSSRSNTPTLYEESSEYSENISQEPATRQILIDDDSNEVDIIEKYDIRSEEDCSSLSSNRSIIRTSAGCIAGDPDTVLSNAAEFEVDPSSNSAPLEEDEAYMDISNENNSMLALKESYKSQEEFRTGENESIEKKRRQQSAVQILAEEARASTDTVNYNDQETNHELETSIDLIAEQDEVNPVSQEENQEQERLKLTDTSEESDSEKISFVDDGLKQNVASNATVKKKNTQIEDNTSRTDAIENKIEAENKNEVVQEKDLQHNLEKERTPNFQRKRSKSFSKTAVVEQNCAASPRSQRHSRGGSLPPSSTSQIVTRRRSFLLETLDENVTPDSPSSRTRSKLRSESIDSEYNSPSVSSIKRVRLPSTSSVSSTEFPHTPKTRQESNMHLKKDMISSPKAAGILRTTSEINIAAEEIITTPLKTPRILSISKTNKSSAGNKSLVESNFMKSLKNRNIAKASGTKLEMTQSDDFRSARRLTRTQLAVLEKSAALAKQISISPARVTRRRSSCGSEKSLQPDVKESDTESLTSHASQSSRRVTRSSVTKDIVDDDRISIASSTESVRAKRKRVKDMNSPNAELTAIPEEETL